MHSCGFSKVWVPEASREELIQIFDVGLQIPSDSTSFWGEDEPFWKGHYLSISRQAVPMSDGIDLPDLLEALTFVFAQQTYGEEGDFWEGKEIVCLNHKVVRLEKTGNVSVLRGANTTVFPVVREFL